MENRYNFMEKYNERNDTENILEYLFYWKYYLVSILVCFFIAFMFLRYASYKFETSTTIQIIDKSQDNEMALPTAMTIFNRSMVNLENDIGVLESFSLHSNVVKTLNSNAKFFDVGLVKTTENHRDEWIKAYNLDFKIELDTVQTLNKYIIEKGSQELFIKHYDLKDNLIEEYVFQKDTYEKSHNLPFELNIDESINNFKKQLIIYPFSQVVKEFQKLIQISPTSNDSDQLKISMKYVNFKVAEDYLNTLSEKFDEDGVKDRKLEYRRTIDFVDSRSIFLKEELQIIEKAKQDFKEKNNLSDIKSDGILNANQRVSYDSELFKAKSQLDLTIIFEENFFSENFSLIPLDIGIENSTINQAILEYNNAIKARDKFLISAGPKNSFVLNLEKQILSFSNNIKVSIKNYKKSLQSTINNIEQKEKEFSDQFSNLPENEKILRSIQRELEIKESLFLLLLQKREEASINLAVVKPAIKIIDSARSTDSPVYPRSLIVYLIAFSLSIAIPSIIIFIILFFDNKIHIKSQLVDALDEIPIIGEIPHSNDSKRLSSISTSKSRDPITESVRMVLANLNFLLFDKKNKRNNVILVTSSVKGEGKTLISVNTSKLLSFKFKKVLLIGADLRNPQIHKFINVDKSVKGLSNYIYSNNLNWKDLIHKNDGLDILLSGAIPPNPTELLSSEKFKNLMKEISLHYDYIVIDSAPCILVSDTFEISKYVDTTLYVVRSNFSDKTVTNFINECKKLKRLENISVILNSVGSNKQYSYKYSYRYGYKYGYKYGYNYGYGYGYSEQKD